MADGRPLVAVLAAGAGTRFGGGKLDAACAGKPVGRWVLDAVEAAGLGAGLIVVAQEPPQFALASAWQIITNENAAAGLGTSLSLAARHALAAERALLVLLADMPLVTDDYLQELASAEGLAATTYADGKTGVPALFPRENLPALMEIKGDSGAGALLSQVGHIKRLTPQADMLIDVDRGKDLARAEQVLFRRG